MEVPKSRKSPKKCFRFTLPTKGGPLGAYLFQGSGWNDVSKFFFLRGGVGDWKKENYLWSFLDNIEREVPFTLKYTTTVFKKEIIKRELL